MLDPAGGFTLINKQSGKYLSLHALKDMAAAASENGSKPALSTIESISELPVERAI